MSWCSCAACGALCVLLYSALCLPSRIIFLSWRGAPSARPQNHRDPGVIHSETIEHTTIPQHKPVNCPEVLFSEVRNKGASFRKYWTIGYRPKIIKVCGREPTQILNTKIRGIHLTNNAQRNPTLAPQYAILLFEDCKLYDIHWVPGHDKLVETLNAFYPDHIPIYNVSSGLVTARKSFVVIQGDYVSITTKERVTQTFALETS